MTFDTVIHKFTGLVMYNGLPDYVRGCLLLLDSEQQSWCCVVRPDDGKNIVAIYTVEEYLNLV